ncbi:hypothetical protein ACOCGI_003673 [Vibrio cholerae]
MSTQRDRFDFRLLELKTPFYQYLADNNCTGAEAMRHFIKTGLDGSNHTLSERKDIKTELIALKREHAAIGRNLNQVTRYFQIHDHLIESDLRRTHTLLKENQRLITDLFNALLKTQ